MANADFREWDALAGDPERLLAAIADSLRAEARFQELFEALQLRCRHELGLPLVGNVDLDPLAPAVRAEFDRRFREDCRCVGELLIQRGDLVDAWPYFQAIQEPGPIATALDAWQPGPETSQEEIAQLIQIGFGLGVNPVRAYQLLLQSGGTCDGIHLIEQRFPFGPKVREQCVDLLVAQLYREVCSGLERDLPTTGVGTAPRAYLADWIDRHATDVQGRMCPVDDSHLQAVIRFSLASRSRPTLECARELADFGTRLDASYQRRETPPFEDFYRDYAVLLGGVTGHIGAAEAEAHFARKLDGVHGADVRFAAEVLVFLLDRMGLPARALHYFERHLLAPGRSLSLAPALADLCSAAGDYRLLRETAASAGNLARYTAALLADTTRRGP